ncbi:hypothetical protein SI90_08805 [Akkermansia muciniphila]|jgi:hypothetical protein|uniref:hypothetical protein n=1 Tax=Akkermansia muciniphila TaxID=239935 RepID=UPI000FF8EB19|nr:hypothetical protein [Akkermansia muciniphila]MCO6190133.1 hypothetical protein [Akkermansia muciniphila]QAR50528.1 hypothetical protein SI90_08805 [Akkermansia muciniphila]
MIKLLACVCSIVVLSFISAGMPLAERIQPSVKVEAAQKKYWISSTGKTHNSSCRYYNNCKGYWSDTGSGNNCKICGGANK